MVSRIEKPLCFADKKVNHNSVICRNCLFLHPCLKEIEEGRGVIRIKKHKTKKDFDIINNNGKVINL